MIVRKRIAARLMATALVMAFAVSPALSQTIVYARGNDSQSMDPGMAASSEDIKIVDWVYDGLVQFDGQSTKIIPALAESWDVAEDGVTWTFKLRTDVTFHDGTPFNAEAVKLSFERQFLKDSPQYSARFLRWRGKLGAMTNVDVVDDSTIVLHFSTPQPALLYNLAIYPGYIVSPAAIAEDAEGLSEAGVGTGPFKFVRWVKDDLIELARNDDYWGEVPKIERLIVRVMPENDVRLLALEKGEIQLTDDVPFNRITELNARDDLKVDTLDAISYSGLIMNRESPKLQDIRVRKAIQMAINRERLFNVMFFKLGTMDQQAMPAGEIGHSDSVPTFPYDPEGAKALLAEAGVAGLELEMIAFNNPRPYFPSPADGTAMIKADLAAVGIDADISMVTWSDWLSRRKSGNFELTVGGWYAGTVDPQGMLYPLFHSDFIGIDNASRLNLPEVDALIDKAIATYDDDMRQKLYAEAMDLIAADAGTVFLAHPIFSLGRRAEVQGVFRNKANQVYLNSATLEN